MSVRWSPIVQAQRAAETGIDPANRELPADAKPAPARVRPVKKHATKKAASKKKRAGK